MTPDGMVAMGELAELVMEVVQRRRAGDRGSSSVIDGLLELPDDANIEEHVRLNPGTVRVERLRVDAT